MTIQLRINNLYNYFSAIRHNVDYVVATGRSIIIWIFLVMLFQIANLNQKESISDFR